MVLAELGQKITSALNNMSRKTIVGEDDVKQMLNEVARALLAADVNVNLVKKLQSQVKAEIALTEGTSMNQRKIIQNAVFNAVKKMLDPGVKPYLPEKGKTSVVMFVGLQGSGKTTSCTKYALYFSKRKVKTGLVCADTFRAGAYDQLKQNAAKADVRFYGSLTEIDPVVIAREGVEQLKKEKYELIIVDTSGRHMQEESLFQEMEDVEKAVKPNDIVYVMDATNGQAIQDQAQEFKNRVAVGSVIITKLDGQAKGGGALSAVAATQSPIIFLGTGEHFDEFEVFNANSFTGKILGRGDVGGLIETIKDANIDAKSETFQRMQDGLFTMRDMYEHLQNVMKLGPLGKVMEMMPGMGHLGNMGDAGNASQTVLRNFIHIMDSMTSKELDEPKVKKMMTPQRMLRVAKGSGRSVAEVHQLIFSYNKFEEVVKKIGKMNFKAMGQDPTAMMGGAGGRQQAQSLAKMLNPQMLKQLGGAANIQSMMKQFAQFQ